ncbi:protein of unknown function [Tepidibacter aestuarii]|nr:protein of unknown function [Tepidibacter aestuarii]
MYFAKKQLSFLLNEGCFFIINKYKYVGLLLLNLFLYCNLTRNKQKKQKTNMDLIFS